MRRYAAEAIGTFALVFAGTGAVVADGFSGGAVGLVGVSLAFGLVVAAMVYTIGDVSGAHINPAVTVAIWATGRFAARDVAPYVAAQCLGAVAASALLWAMFPDAESLGPTLPVGPLWRSLVMEVVLTFFLMFVVLGVTAPGKPETVLAGLVIGGTVSFAVFCGAPVCGASMNPARSLGPALVGGDMGPMWLYVVGPVGGALLAVAVSNYLRRGVDHSQEELIASAPEA
ncbi:aquaporin [Botrimarina sp.]|uniref:MIP/aquaporin family protein n=1 Tax=Botrimarina sp. TaxID=2795802 RepID=UPI0032EED187